MFTACGSSANLVGKWTYSSGDVTSDYPEDYVEFHEDGTVRCDDLEGTYTVKNGKISMSIMLGSYTYDYKISGGKLVLNSNIYYEKE